MLNSILSNASAASVAMEEFFICAAASLVLGMALAWIHNWKNQATRNFTLTLTLLPVIVQTVIMLVNGNLGTGVAVMGAFSLVRFRSAPGNSREIGSIFLAMAIGLANGMGYLGVAFLLLVMVGCVTVNMGSLYELQYHIGLKDEKSEKEFLDQVRCRNGNLSLVCGRIPSGREEL